MAKLSISPAQRLERRRLSIPLVYNIAVGTDDKKKDNGGTNKTGLKAYAQAEQFMQIAIMLPAAVFIGWLGGAWLDRHLHQHWISILGIFLGAAAGLTYVVRLVLRSGGES